jgi:hypothetical protein
MGRRSSGQRANQTRNGDLVTADIIQSTGHASYLGTTTKTVRPSDLGSSQEDSEGELMMTEGAGACDESRLHMVGVDFVVLGVERVSAGGLKGAGGGGHTQGRKWAVVAMPSV